MDEPLWNTTFYSDRLAVMRPLAWLPGSKVDRL